MLYRALRLSEGTSGMSKLDRLHWLAMAQGAPQRGHRSTTALYLYVLAYLWRAPLLLPSLWAPGSYPHLSPPCCESQQAVENL